MAKVYVASKDYTILEAEVLGREEDEYLLDNKNFKNIVGATYYFPPRLAEKGAYYFVMDDLDSAYKLVLDLLRSRKNVLMTQVGDVLTRIDEVEAQHYDHLFGREEKKDDRTDQAGEAG